MTKYLLLALLLAIIGVGIWFWRLPGPKQLDLADRLYPAGGSFGGSVDRGIGYGENPMNRLDIYRPASKGPHPVILFFHGGSWRDGARGGYGFVGRNFAARGFVTVVADYRKLPQHVFPAFVEDTAAATHWVHENIASKGGDAERIFLMGHSAGAHTAMLAALDPQWLAAHGSAPSIIAGVVGISGPYNFLPFEEGGPADLAMGSWPDLKETQPITYAAKDAPPLLLLTGKADKTVFPRNSLTLNEAIRAAGGRSTIKQYSGIDHVDPIMAISRPFRSKATVLEDSVTFMKASSIAAQ